MVFLLSSIHVVKCTYSNGKPPLNSWDRANLDKTYFLFYAWLGLLMSLRIFESTFNNFVCDFLSSDHLRLVSASGRH